MRLSAQVGRLFSPLPPRRLFSPPHYSHSLGITHLALLREAMEHVPAPPPRHASTWAGASPLLKPPARRRRKTAALSPPPPLSPPLHRGRGLGPVLVPGCSPPFSTSPNLQSWWPTEPGPIPGPLNDVLTGMADQQSRGCPGLGRGPWKAARRGRRAPAEVAYVGR